MTKSQILTPKSQIGHWSLVVVLLAFALRIYRLDGQGFWSDEFLAVWRAQLPWPEMFEKMPAEHVPLYFILLKLWLAIAGDTDFTIRFLAAAFSLLVVPFTYRLASDILDFRLILDQSKIRNPVGLLAAFLLAISPFQIWYAQENRMYSLLVAAGLASLVFLFRGLWRGGRPTWTAYTLATAVVIYTHYYAFLLVAAEALFVTWWILQAPIGMARRDVWKPWLVSAGAVALLFLPWVPFATRLFTHRGWRQGADVLALPGRFIAAYSVGTSVTPGQASLLTLGFVALFAVGAVGLARRSIVVAWLLALTLGIPLIGGMLLALRQPDFHERYFIFVTPIYFLAIATGIIWLGRRVLLWGGLALLFVTGTDVFSLYNHYFNPAYAKIDYRAVARYLETRVEPEDGIVPNGPEIGYVARYFRGDLPPHYDNVAGEYFEERGGPEFVLPLLRDMAAQHSRVWMLWKWGGAEYVKDWFDRNGYQVSGEWVNDVRVFFYSFPTQSPTIFHPVTGVQAGGAIALAGYQIVPEPTPSGSVLNLALFWEPLSRPARNYKTALRLLDPAGRIVAALDRLPLDGTAPTSAWRPGRILEDHYGLQLPPGTPPVDHVLQVQLYDPEAATEVLTTRLAPIPVVRPAKPLDPAHVRVQHRLQTTWGDRLELIGYELPPEPLRAGDLATVALLWRATAPGVADGQVRFTWTGRPGNVLSQTHPLNAIWPPDRWETGDLIRTVYDLRVPAAAPGDLRLEVELLDGAGQSPGTVILGTVAVQVRSRTYQTPRISHPASATLGEGALFLGYDLDRERVAPGGTLKLTLYWQVLGSGQAPAFDKNYAVFVHFLDPSGVIRGQKDSPPLDGTAPTTSWLPGEVLTDSYTIPVNPDAPPGAYVFEMGMYDPATGQRLPILDAEGNPLPDNRIILDQVPVWVGEER